MNYGIIPLILRRYSCKITDWESRGGKWLHSDSNDVVVFQTDDNRLEIFLVGADKCSITDGRQNQVVDGFSK
jgi:hypothetical protein